MATVTYNDGATAGITNGYDRRGRLVTISNAAIVTTLTYNDASEVLCESYSGGLLSSISVTNGYDSLLRRTNCVTLYGGTVLASTTYGYDAASRLSTVSDGTNSATYGYLANSPLVQYLTDKQSGTTRMTTTKAYDNLNRLTSISSAAGSTVLDSHGYAYNSANQRTSVTNVDNSYWVYQYDSLGQVTSGIKYWGDGSVVAGQQFGYGFDTIGNRTATSAGGDQWGANLRYASYSANNLNQYTSRTVPGAVDVIGSATNTATVTVNDLAAYRKSNYYRVQLPLTNAGGAVWQSVTNLAVLTEGTSDVRLSGLTNNVFLPQTPESFTYDADGNLTADGRWIYTWDAENRLVCMTNKSGVPSGAQMQLNFTYDSKGRRINKTVIASGVTNTLKFVYDGWNLLASLTNSSTLNEVFTWGLDLSGSMQGAGGVGGLLIVNQPTAQTAFVAYDGNGNVSALVNAANSSVLAQYEYGPFGEVIRASGPMAKLNPFRFSTKYQDDETDLLYYGCRYYNASNGRWLIRDPLEEQGFDCLQNVDTFGDSSGPNLYNFVANEPLSDIDLFGLKLGDVTGEHALPPYNPSQIGKKCCGMSHCPAHITGTRTDQPPTVYKGSVIIYTSWQLHLSVHINPDSDCYTDVRVDWTRCWGTGGAGYMGSGTEISIPVSTWNHIGGSVTYLTTARINYLTCENGVWAKKLTIAGLSYTWNGSGWEFFTSDNGQISLGE